MVFLAVSFVLIFAYTAWNIAHVIRINRLRRELEKFIAQREGHHNDD